MRVTFMFSHREMSPQCYTNLMFRAVGDWFSGEKIILKWLFMFLDPDVVYFHLWGIVNVLCVVVFPLTVCFFVVVGWCLLFFGVVWWGASPPTPPSVKCLVCCSFPSLFVSSWWCFFPSLFVSSWWCFVLRCGVVVLRCGVLWCVGVVWLGALPPTLLVFVFLCHPHSPHPRVLISSVVPVFICCFFVLFWVWCIRVLVGVVGGGLCPPHPLLCRVVGCIGWWFFGCCLVAAQPPHLSHSVFHPFFLFTFIVSLCYSGLLYSGGGMVAWWWGAQPLLSSISVLFVMPHTTDCCFVIRVLCVVGWGRSSRRQLTVLSIICSICDEES